MSSTLYTFGDKHPEPSTVEPEKKKRRRRMTIVCARCRRKKAKCDRKTPCNQCIRANCLSECTYNTRPKSTVSYPDESKARHDGLSDSPVQYNTPPEVPVNYVNEYVVRAPLLRSCGANTTMLEEMHYLIGVNPVVRSADMINLHMDTSSVNGSVNEKEPYKSWSLPYRGIRLSARPIAFNEASQQELGTTLIWKYSYTGDRMKSFLRQTLKIRDPNVLRSTAEHYGPTYISNVAEDSNSAKLKITAYGYDMGYCYSSICGEKYHIHESLRSIFPKRVVLFTYLEWFFAKVYPLYPIVDEAWIFEQVNRLFTYSENGNVLLLVNSGPRVDYLVIGIILLMTRLAYLGELSNIRSHNDELLNSPRIGGFTMKDYPISLSAVELAFELIYQGSYKRKISFLYIQASMLKSIYRMLALENDAALYSCDTDCSVSHLALMVAFLSLERDPENISGLPGEEKHRNLRRKIWYTLVQIDYHTVFVFHNARCITPGTYNIPLPHFSAEGSNIKDLELEEKTIQAMCQTYDALRAADELISINLDLKSNYKVTTVLEALASLEMSVYEKLGTLGSIIERSREDRWSKILGTGMLRTQMLIKMFVASIHYFLHVYYLKKGDRTHSFFFLRKVLLNLYCEMSWISPELLIKSDDYFDPVFTLVMSPVILIYAHICSLASGGIHVRLQCALIASNPSPERKLLIEELICKHGTVMQKKLKMCKFLGERYFFAWKCSKTHSFALDVIESNSVYETYKDLVAETAADWTDLQLADLSAAMAEEPHIRLEDDSILKSYFYHDSPSIVERSMSSPDLYKSIQTDHFWILFNSITEKEIMFFGAPVASGKARANDIQTQNLNESTKLEEAVSGTSNTQLVHSVQDRQVKVEDGHFNYIAPEQPQLQPQLQPQPQTQPQTQLQPQLQTNPEANGYTTSYTNGYVPPYQAPSLRQTLVSERNGSISQISDLLNAPRTDLQSFGFPSVLRDSEMNSRIPDRRRISRVFEKPPGPQQMPSTQDLFLYSTDIMPDLEDLLDFDFNTDNQRLDDFFACSSNATNRTKNT